MGVPAKGYDAYKHDQGLQTQVGVPGRKLINHEKRQNQSSQKVKTGFEPNGRVCSKPTKNFD
jgi:hypothetical protein